MEYICKQFNMGVGLRQIQRRKSGGTVAFVDNRKQTVIQDKREERISKKQLNAGGSFQVLQGVLTRSMVRGWVDEIENGTVSLENFRMLNEYDQYLILSAARDRGIDVSAFRVFLWLKDFYAEENSDVDHPDCDDAQEYTESQVSQLKRGPGLSGPRSNALMTNAYYMRDGNGNINFASPVTFPPYISWSNPVKANSEVDLENGSIKRGYGILKNGKYVKISDASRSQHFSIANRVAEAQGKTYSSVAGSSPSGYTWHHLIDRYKMVLVDRKTHQQFGHNGGYYFW